MYEFLKENQEALKIVVKTVVTAVFFLLMLFCAGAKKGSDGCEPAKHCGNCKHKPSGGIINLKLCNECQTYAPFFKNWEADERYPVKKESK